jgi:hypothetical protein
MYVPASKKNLNVNTFLFTRHFSVDLKIEICSVIFGLCGVCERGRGRR